MWYVNFLSANLYSYVKMKLNSVKTYKQETKIINCEETSIPNMFKNYALNIYGRYFCE